MEEKERPKLPFDVREDIVRLVRNETRHLEAAGGRTVFNRVEDTDDTWQFVVHLDTRSGPKEMKALKVGRWIGHWKIVLDGKSNGDVRDPFRPGEALADHLRKLCVTDVEWIAYRMLHFDVEYHQTDGDHYRSLDEEFRSIKRELSKLGPADLARLRGAPNAEHWLGGK